MTQREALDILKTGANVFVTGEPGSGKTYLVNEYVSYLRSRGVEPAITASTGIAATHIGGFTIHSWSGIGVRSTLTKYDLDRIWQNKKVVSRVENARILIIDEISMLSARTLSLVDAVCRAIRRNREPMGGLQMILVGDFFQLPPVSAREKRDEKEQTSFIPDKTSDSFAYRSPVWSALNPVICYLSEQHRQEDPIFLEFLSAVRRQSITEHHKDILRGRYSRNPKGKITQLYSHNADVDALNKRELERLPGNERMFDMESRGPENLVAALMRGCLSPEKLVLKVGARVMFTKNDVVRRHYVNGTLGIVVGFSKFSKGNGFPLVKTHDSRMICAEPDEWRIEDGGRVLARITQIPLRLAWAMTVHKSQGMSLDAAHMDLSQTFEYGQGYVALSRVRTLTGLSLAGLNDRALEVHPDVSLKDGEFRMQSDEARRKFSEFGTIEMTTLHENFIRACGGSRKPADKPQETRETVSTHLHKHSLPRRESTYATTHALLKMKKTLGEIADERGLTLETILSHAEKLAEEKKLDRERDLMHIALPTRFNDIKKALESVQKKEGRMFLSSARALLGNDCDYVDLRLARLFLL